MQRDLRGVKELFENFLQTLKNITKPLFTRTKMFLERMVFYVNNHKILKGAVMVVAVVIMIFAAVLTFVIIDTPGREELKSFRNPVPSEIFTADSVLIGRYFIQDRKPVQFDEISPSVIDAVIATEDVRFYEHNGIDGRSLGRVLVKTILLQDESSGGGSTITQQLAKNIFPRKNYWVLSIVMNKLREAVIAIRLEKIYTKKEILTLYLNTIPFGDNTYGIQAAARRFFSCSASDLKPDQAAILIGMLKATHSYNPRLFPENARGRRNVVIAQMGKYGFLDSKETHALQAGEMNLKLGQPKKEDGIAPYFREYVKTEMLKWCKKNKKPDGSNYNLYTDGLKIYTTIDSKLQAYAEKAVTRQMTGLQKQFFDHWGTQQPWGENEQVILDALRRTPRYREMKQRGLSEAEIIRKMEKPSPAVVFSWDGPQQVKMSPLDSIRHHIQFLNAGFLAMDPASGDVKAWVGGIDHDFFQYDHVKETTKRQVGSVFKPIVYAQAIEEGVSPCEFISAGQETYIDGEGEAWTPKNSQYDYPVQYSMRGGLAYSVNTVSVKLINRAGIENTIRLARNMGIKSEIPDVPSIALGSSGISLMEMTAAYSCFSNEGITQYPVFIREVHDREGNVMRDFNDEVSGKRALSKETSLLIRHMLQTVVHEGTAARLRYRYGVYNDVAGKTGTTQANADGWFMAMTPNLVMGSWVGADDPRIRFRHTRLGEGSNTALPIVAYFLKEINADKKYKTIAQAEFPPLPREIRSKLACDLYEIDDELWARIETSIHSRDSIIQADTLAPPPPVTFLQTLYNRKRKIYFASEVKATSENTSSAVNASGPAMN